MCNQRDRLIAYIYNECDTAERDLVQQHIDACAECRVEIAGLRSVREDLLAWDVPAHESVWRPFAPAPAKQWWRQVPAWAMATAAAVVMLSGAAGGAVLHAFWPETASVQRNDAAPITTAAVSPTQPMLTMADLSASEQRLVAMVREQVTAVDARVHKISMSSQAAHVDGTHDALVAEIMRLRGENKDQLDLISRFYANIEGLRTEQKLKNFALQSQFNELRNLVTSQLADGKTK